MKKTQDVKCAAWDSITLALKESYNSEEGKSRVNIIFSGTSLHVKPELWGQKSQFSSPIPPKK